MKQQHTPEYARCKEKMHDESDDGLRGISARLSPSALLRYAHGKGKCESRLAE